MDRVTSGTTTLGKRAKAPRISMRGSHKRVRAKHPTDTRQTDIRETDTKADQAAHPRHDHPHHAERRHSFRVPVDGRASIWLRGRLHGHYALSDLSIAGCSLRDGPPCYPGEHVEVVLHLPDRPPFWLGAQIRRCEEEHAAEVHGVDDHHFSLPRASKRARAPRASEGASEEKTARFDHGALGVCFEHTDPRSEDRLQDLVVEVYTRMHADSDSFSLVIDARSHVRRGLVHNLDIVGERAVAVATPLDAVQLLLERGECVSTAFIGPDRADAPTYELVEFLARNYPRVRRVLVGDASEVAGAWVAEATGEVHGLLETPCSEDSLRRLVHRISALPHEELS